MKKPTKKEIFKAFTESNDILIVDKNPGSRNRLIKIMSDLGSKRHMIHSVGTFLEAEEVIKTKNIGLILSDFYIGGGSGFDLFKMVHEKNDKKICTILVTSDMNQSTVAKAAEEDVDSFIIKPFTVDSIQASLINTVSDKLYPSIYKQTIDEGKALMLASSYDNAIVKFEYAKTLHSKPALALFYIGQCEYLKEMADQAKGSYKEGLTFSNIHFKCLIGLFELLLQRNELENAYDVVKKIAKYFPANPDRLQQIVRLAVQTKNFQDMPFYYEVFTSLDERQAHMINYIGAGLFVSGKHFLLAKQTKDALSLFDNIGVSCSEFTKFPKAIISLLIDHEMTDEAEKFLKRFAPESRETPDYLISDFLVTAKKFKDHNTIVKIGLGLYNKNIRDYQCMTQMISSMEQVGYKKEKIEPFLEEINSRWPESKAS